MRVKINKTNKDNHKAICHFITYFQITLFVLKLKWRRDGYGTDTQVADWHTEL